MVLPVLKRKWLRLSATPNRLDRLSRYSNSDYPSADRDNLLHTPFLLFYPVLAYTAHWSNWIHSPMQEPSYAVGYALHIHAALDPWHDA